MVRSTRARWLVITASILCAAVNCFADDADQKKEAAPKIDPQADHVLKSASDHLASLDRFEVKVQMAMKMNRQGMKVEMDTKQEIRVQRPNKLSVVSEASMPFGGGTMISDGEKLYTYMSATKKYTVKDAPKTLAGFRPDRPSMVSVAGMGIENLLLSENLYDEIVEDVHEVSYVGIAEMNGVPCHHLRLIQDEVEVELWIESGEQPVLRRMVPDMQKAIQKISQDGAAADSVKNTFQGMEIDFVLNLNDWNSRPEFNEENFQVHSPGRSGEGRFGRWQLTKTNAGEPPIPGRKAGASVRA